MGAGGAHVSRQQPGEASITAVQAELEITVNAMMRLLMEKKKECPVVSQICTFFY